MSFVFEIYRADGSLAFDASTIVAKYIGTIRIPYDGVGSLTVPEWATPGVLPLYGIIPVENTNSSYQPYVTLSGNTLSWQPNVVPQVSNYMGNPMPVDLIYGYF